MLKDLDVDVLSNPFALANAFITATLRENHGTIRYLASIGGDINSCNELGVTPLHAAATLTSGATCRLLLQLACKPKWDPEWISVAPSCRLHNIQWRSRQFAHFGRRKY